MRWIAVAIGIAALLWLAVLGVRPDDRARDPTLDLAAALSTHDAGYARADHVREFRFPTDHGPHPRFRHEWWYFTGNLKTPSGRRFGYELTIFRFALSPQRAERASHWGTNQLYMGHLALTDPQRESFDFFERFSRGALGLAGARAMPFKVWLEDWEIASLGERVFPWWLSAKAGDVTLDLTLRPVKPRVLQGDRGLDRKSAAGDASYYYSYTRLGTTGTLRVGARAFMVSGWSWLDREWSSGALAEDQQGWDWFALQLDNGADLMFYRLRGADGTTDPNSGGVWVTRRGNPTSLAHDDATLSELDYWSSPRGGAYPARWRLSVPQRDCKFTITPLLADQELDASVRYWEGAVAVRGACRGEEIRGRGYVELTGYAQAL
jgi:predicted secreted hydrolase